MNPSPRIIVTRRVEQAGEFADKLTAAGFTPILFPTIELAAMDQRPLDKALSQIETFDWLIFTSVNAVDFFFRRVDALDLRPRWPKTAPKLGVVGTATAARLAQHGLTPDFMPAAFVGEALAAGLGDLRGQRILLPRAKAGRPELVANLQAQGAIVVEIGLYETKTAVSPQKLPKEYEAITFASPSSVDGFMELATNKVDDAIIACIGPITAAAAKKYGLHVAITPVEYTIDGLVTALTQHFKPTFATNYD